MATADFYPEGVNAKYIEVIITAPFDTEIFAGKVVLMDAKDYKSLQEQVRVLRSAFVKARDILEFIDQEAYNESNTLHEISYHIKKKLVGLESKEIEEALAATDKENE